MQYSRPECGLSSPASRPPRIARAATALSCAALMTLFGCARADNPEQFQADPALMNDFTYNLPSRGSSLGYEYAIVQGMAVFEGDIILGEVDQYGNLPSKNQARGLFINDLFGRWPDGIIPYTPPESNSAAQQSNISAAIEHWMERTRITFVERTTENADKYPHYLHFVSTPGSCASYVGMRGGEQEIRVSDACSVGSIVHEIGHAIGLFHEHTRSDRDNFVQIDWDQVVADKTINFELQNAGTVNVGPYDYGSIMHYGEFFFSATGMPTIIVPDGVEIGQREALSEIDASSVDSMYATDLALMEPSVFNSDQGLEMDVTVLNKGELGAHGLELVIRVSSDTQWQGISANSGWDCLSKDAALHCSRETLAEQMSSRFTLLLDPGSGSSDDISMYLASRTMDTSSGNNSYNDDGTLARDLGVFAEDDADSSTTVTVAETTTVSPPLAAAQSGSSADEASAAGSAQGAIMLAMLSLLGCRRRRYSPA